MTRLEHDLPDARPDAPVAAPPVDPAAVRPSPLAALRRRWGLALALALVGLAGGLALAQGRPVQHTAEARLVVGQLDVTAQAVPGFALATQQLATTYSRLIVGDQVARDVREALGAGADDVIDYRASAIPESAVIRVEAVATSADAAVRATDTAAAALVGQVNRLLLADPGGVLLQQYAASRTRVAQATVTLADARRALERADTQEEREVAAREQQEAQSRLDTVRLESDTLATRYQQAVNGVRGAPVQPVAAAAVTGDDRLRTLQLFGLGGLGLGLLLALLMSVWASAREARRGGRQQA